MNELDDKIEHQAIVTGSEDEFDSLQSNARNNFVRKVYSILTIQMLITTAFVCFSMFNAAFAMFQTENYWLLWVSFAFSIVSLLVLVCVNGAATKSPINIILLSVFTLAESYMVSMICTLYTPASVLNAAVATLGATIGLTLFAIKTKSDYSDNYSKYASFFWSFLFVSTFLILLNVFVIESNFLNIVISLGIAAIYSIYLIIDTQLIMGSKKHELSLDNYILGAAMLYIDIIQLFLSLLRILGTRE